MATNIFHAIGAVVVSVGLKLMLEDEEYATPALIFGLFLLTYVVW